MREVFVREKSVVIMRGCPGSGKSTYLSRYYPGAFVCSADEYYVDERGDYRFNPKEIKWAHLFCQNAFIAALKNSLPLIAVDNTNTLAWEFEKYVQLARNYGYNVLIVRIEVDPEKAAKRNVHGVAKHKVLQMHERIEDYEGEKVVRFSEMVL